MTKKLLDEMNDVTKQTVADIGTAVEAAVSRPLKEWTVAPGDPTCVFTGDIATPIKFFSKERAAMVVAAVNAYRASREPRELQRYSIHGVLTPISENGVAQIGLTEIRHASVHDVYLQADVDRAAQPPGLSLEERMHRFPKRGWAIDVGVPFAASDPEAEHPLTFRAKHLGGNWDEFESLDLDGAVTWLEQRLGITKGAG